MGGSNHSFIITGFGLSSKLGEWFERKAYTGALAFLRFNPNIASVSVDYGFGYV